MSKFTDKIKGLGGLLKDTFTQWNEREPFNNAIIIAYYTIFSLPGLLVIIINLAGYFFGKEAVTNQITTQVGGIIGGDTSNQVETIIAKASQSEGTVLSSILGAATLIFGATGIFYQLQQILNKMWEVKPTPKQKILKLVIDRVFSFGIILIIGFLLLVSLVLSAALAAMGDWIAAYFTETLNVVFRILNLVLSFGVVTVVFAAIYKFLPDAKVQWRDVWMGAILTAILFVIAKYALSIYFGQSDPGSAYGAAGSIILIMLWTTYAGMILLFGAEFTQVYAKSHGRSIQPSSHAVSTKGENDNGAIVNKKTNKEAKGEKTREGESTKRANGRSYPKDFEINSPLGKN